MIDIHSHMLFKMDDGANSLVDSINMAKMAVSNGTRKMFMTPHYSPENSPANFFEVCDNRLSQLREALLKEKIDLEIKGGAEVKLSYELSKNKSLNRMVLDDTSYILLELRQNQVPLWLEFELYNIMLKGLCPIIAHGERIENLNSKLPLLKKLSEQGVLIQVNSESLNAGLFDYYRGKAKLLMKNNLAHLIGSDGHDTINRKPIISKNKETVQIEKMLENNIVIWENREF